MVFEKYYLDNDRLNLYASITKSFGLGFYLYDYFGFAIYLGPITLYLNYISKKKDRKIEEAYQDLAKQWLETQE